MIDYMNAHLSGLMSQIQAFITFFLLALLGKNGKPINGGGGSGRAPSPVPPGGGPPPPGGGQALLSNPNHPQNLMQNTAENTHEQDPLQEPPSGPARAAQGLTCHDQKSSNTIH